MMMDLAGNHFLANMVNSVMNFFMDNSYIKRSLALFVWTCQFRGETDLVPRSRQPQCHKY